MGEKNTDVEPDLTKWYGAGPFKIGNVLLVLSATKPLWADYRAERKEMVVSFDGEVALRSDGAAVVMYHVDTPGEVPHGSEREMLLVTLEHATAELGDLLNYVERGEGVKEQRLSSMRKLVVETQSLLRELEPTRSPRSFEASQASAVIPT
ncbi:MAG: hypothetical protein J3T61_05735 [Candidatus Brocadiales bacterium]|nr:hypothetical protein [Candidatus Bathyanammoxibius sp.]